MPQRSSSIDRLLQSQRKEDGRLVIHYEILKVPKRTFALLSLGGSFYLIGIGHPLIGAVLPVLAILWLFTDSGIEFDLGKGRYRKFDSYFGGRTGEWGSSNIWEGILPLPGKGSKEVPPPHMAAPDPLKFRDRFFDVHLTDGEHRRKLFLKSFKEENEAREYAEGISADLGLPIEKYSPTVSERTRSRKKRKRR